MMRKMKARSLVDLPAQTGALARGRHSEGANGKVSGETVHSVVTPDDFASEEEAQLAAEQLITRL
jgi:hypothetical protein